jgi:thioredoxin-like negative regulator of GroEL
MIRELDVDENPRMSALYCLRMVPTVVLFISGKEQQRIEGLTNKKHLSSTIEMQIGPGKFRTNHLP